MSRPFPSEDPPHVAIACGGTGGHLFPGLAVAEVLFERGASVSLVVSPKDIDRRVLRGEERFEVLTVPAVGFSWRRAFRFLRQCVASYRQVRRAFRAHLPAALLAMGGFTSVPPAMAARSHRIPVFLHEANAIPGRANRWLASRASRGYAFFPEVRNRWRVRQLEIAGMPVRAQFFGLDRASCRMALGLHPSRPVLLVVGGSQGAEALNEAVIRSLAGLRNAVPDLQYIHLTGGHDHLRVKAAHAMAGSPGVVRAFLTEMDLALGAADAALARAGASSLAEFAATGVPPVLVPYPHAADDHQVANARAFEATGAARVVLQSELDVTRLTAEVAGVLLDGNRRESMRRALATWQTAEAAGRIADEILSVASAGSLKGPGPGVGRGAGVAGLA